ELPDRKVSRFAGQYGGVPVKIADFSHLPVRSKFIAMMPQWDFLDFLSARAKAFAGFTLLMHAEVYDLIEESGRVVGVRAAVNGATQDIRADLVVGADSRHTTVRDKAGLEVDDIGAPMDV